MGSMHTGLEDSRKDFDRLAAYFAERAAGGVRLIVTGGFAPLSWLTRRDCLSRPAFDLR